MPQPPEGAQLAEEGKLAELEEFPNPRKLPAETSFLVSLLLHSGHSGVSELDIETSFSKR